MQTDGAEQPAEHATSLEREPGDSGVVDFEGQRYYDAGQSFRNAYGILAEACDFPPSFEVFCHTLKELRRRSPQITPEIIARQIADDYKRNNFYGYHPL